MEIEIVPEPKNMEFTGRWFKVDGFSNFPEFLALEFNIPHRSWRLRV